MQPKEHDLKWDELGKVQVLFRAHTKYIAFFRAHEKYNLFPKGDILAMACIYFKSLKSTKGEGMLGVKRSYHINKTTKKSKEGSPYQTPIQERQKTPLYSFGMTSDL